MVPTGPRLSEWLGRLARYLYLADLIPDREILDLGCGVGLGCEFLANHGAKRVLGVDANRDAIAEARVSHALVNVDYLVSRYDALELEDQSVDLIWASGAETLRKQSVVAELRRVLRSDGHLVFSVASADRAGMSGGASFHELGDRLGSAFGAHFMIAVQPLTALTLVEYADGEPDIELDTSLSRLGGGRHDVHEYVAVFGPAAEAARPYTVIQLPGSDGLEAIADALGLGERGAEQLLAEVDHQRKARHRAETSVADLKIRVAELERLVAGGESARGGLAVEVDWAASMPEPPMVAPADQPTVVSMGSERLAEVLGEHAIYVDKLERALAEAREYAEEMVEDRAQVERQLGDARRELEAEKARVVTMRGQIGDWRDRAARAEGQLLRANLERGSALVTSKLDIEGARKRLSEAEELLGEQLSVARELESLAGELASETAAGSDDLEAAAAAGNREAEVALLTVGLRSLKSRLRELADELAGARQEGADELAGAVVRTIARLRNFSRD